jgi:diketogulonate reductase-like aldo/keto reductase
LGLIGSTWTCCIGVGRCALPDAFHVLQRTGLIRHWGVSNFDLSSTQQLVSLPRGAEVSSDQVLYNLHRRGIEYDLLSWCRQRGLPIMAYSPIAQGQLVNNTVLDAVGAGHAATPAQVALAWWSGSRM